jgi:hypothetical protein
MKELISQKRSLEAKLTDLTQKRETLLLKKNFLEDSLSTLKTDLEKADKAKSEAFLLVAHGHQGSEESLRQAKRKREEAGAELAEAEEMLSAYESAEADTRKAIEDTRKNLDLVLKNLSRLIFEAEAATLKKEALPRLLRLYAIRSVFIDYNRPDFILKELFDDLSRVEASKLDSIRAEVLSSI